MKSNLDIIAIYKHFVGFVGLMLMRR